MDYFDCGSAKLAYKIFGNGEITLVIDTALGACSAEWWHIAEKLSIKYRVVVFDRAGYGKSTFSKLTRNPRNIALELNELLIHNNILENIILVGHSQGGLYSLEYAYMHPDNVIGVVFLDPATPFDYEFTEKLTADEYRKSGVNKTFSLKAGKFITSLGLGIALKPLLKKSPPFCYYDFSANAQKYILNSLYKRRTYITALEEYKYTHNDEYTKDIINAVETTTLNSIPVKLITHSSEVYIHELEHYANIDSITAQKIETLWQKIMKKYLSTSCNSEHITAPNSGHYIHLTDLNILENAIAHMV